MYCSNCGEKNLGNSSVCSKCGKAIEGSKGNQSTQQNRFISDVEALYEAAIGPKNTGYYLSHFHRFDTDGAGVSWNWPAFFITLFWLLYRKMWGWAALYFLFINFFTFFLALPTVGLVLSAASLVIVYLLIPMYANAIYHRHVKQKIQKITSTTSDRQMQLPLLALTSGTSNVTFWIILVFLIIMLTGILAAIALPAYQDYTVRSKMSEPLGALAEAKTVIANHVAENGRYPADFGSLNISTGPRPDSDIMASLAVARDASDETVRIVANVASCTWQGGVCNDTDYKSFHLAGTINPDGTMTWTCRPGDQDGTNAVEIKFLPANCRN